KVCPPPTPHFTGRQDILQHMTTYFNTTIGRRHVFLLHGLGGAGKSQIAFKYVEMSTFPEPRLGSFSEVYFIDSSTRQTIENDLVALALAKQIGKTAQASLLWLSHQHKEWLIVFNNADNINLNLREFFPTGFHGNILVTSRNPALGQHAHAQYKVDQMDLEDAIDLLLAAATCDPTILEYREIAKRIVQKLCCFPLAVAQAGASISSLHALHHYLELYETATKRIQQLNRRPVQSEYEWSVYTTWQISFEKLSSPAAQLLQLCSFIHHDGITEKIFKQAASYKSKPTDGLNEPQEFLTCFLEDTGSNWDLQKFFDIIAELRHYSLIEFGAVSRNFTFSIHPLVHEWCRTTVNSGAPTELCMHKLMGMSIASGNNNFWLNHQLFPHIDALLFSNTGEVGPKAMANLAITYTQLGQPRQAEKLEQTVLKKRKNILGKDHPDTLWSMANLAIIYLHLGQLRQAEQLEHTVLKKRKDILGEDHPDTLGAMANLAYTYFQLGQLRQAEELDQIVWKKRKEILGKDHPDTLSAMENLAVTYSRLGQFRKAEELQQIFLKNCKETLGEDHPDTLRAMGNLATRYSQLGQFKRAEELQITTWTKHKDILGE
ncbi:P-loop containing nucleoside triphosphate hydrolase protein, partial [Mycena epipterygia]